MSKLEGELKINELGQILINDHVIYAGSIIEIKIKSEWVQVCIEQAHGTFYTIPQADLSAGITARVVE